METKQFDHLLRDTKIIAIVGLSAKPDRPSYGVAQYLQQHAYRIVPVNPVEAGNTILGEPCYASLTEAAAALAQQGEKIDMVDCFRQSQFMPEVVKEALQIHAACIWMQLGVSHTQSAELAQQAGVTVVMNRCVEIEHINWLKRQEKR